MISKIFPPCWLIIFFLASSTFSTVFAFGLLFAARFFIFLRLINLFSTSIYSSRTPNLSSFFSNSSTLAWSAFCDLRGTLMFFWRIVDRRDVRGDRASPDNVCDSLISSVGFFYIVDACFEVGWSSATSSVAGWLEGLLVGSLPILELLLSRRG